MSSLKKIIYNSLFFHSKLFRITSYENIVWRKTTIKPRNLQSDWNVSLFYSSVIMFIQEISVLTKTLFFFEATLILLLVDRPIVKYSNLS